MVPNAVLKIALVAEVHQFRIVYMEEKCRRVGSHLGGEGDFKLSALSCRWGVGTESLL